MTFVDPPLPIPQFPSPLLSNFNIIENGLDPGSLASKAFHPHTDRKHKTLLRALSVLVGTPAERAVTYLQRRQNTVSASTLLGDAASIIGAEKQAQLYSPAMAKLFASKPLKTDPLFQRTLRTLRKRAHSQPPREPSALRTKEAHAVMSLLRILDPLAHLAFGLWWMTAARPGDILQLLRSEVLLEDPRCLRVRFLSGKGVTIRGPYTVFTLWPWVPDLIPWSGPRGRPTPDPLFPPSRRLGLHEIMLAALRAIRPALEARSVRRGSLQAMAANGTPEDTLLNFSGHKDRMMLFRYLGWGWERGQARLDGSTAALALI